MQSNARPSVFALAVRAVSPDRRAGAFICAAAAGDHWPRPGTEHLESRGIHVEHHFPSDRHVRQCSSAGRGSLGWLNDRSASLRYRYGCTRVELRNSPHSQSAMTPASGRKGTDALRHRKTLSAPKIARHASPNANTHALCRLPSVPPVFAHRSRRASGYLDEKRCVARSLRGAVGVPMRHVSGSRPRSGSRRPALGRKNLVRRRV